MIAREDILKLIREEVRKQLNIILSGQTGVTQDQFSEDVVNLFPGMPPLTSRPIMHPYGFVSRAPKGTVQVTARQGEHAGNRLVLGHRDANRPPLAQPGEVALYDQYGHVIYLSQSKMQFGSKASAEPMVLGTQLQTFLSNLIDAILAQTHLGNLGIATSPPLNAATFSSKKASPVQDGGLVSGKCFTEK